VEENSPFPVTVENEPSSACTAVKKLACPFQVESLPVVSADWGHSLQTWKKENRQITESSGSKTSATQAQADPSATVHLQAEVVRVAVVIQGSTTAQWALSCLHSTDKRWERQRFMQTSVSFWLFSWSLLLWKQLTVAYTPH